MLALAFSLAVVATPAPSSPEGAQVSGTVAPIRVAQAPEPEVEPDAPESPVPAPAEAAPHEARQREEKALEQDMDRAREHLHEEGDDTRHRHGEPQQAWRRYDERDRATQQRARRLYGNEGPEVEDVPRRGPAHPPIPQPTLAGHGKAYYLTWGIVDYAIAGQLWLGGTMLSLVAVTLGVSADEIARESRGEFCASGCNDRDRADAIRAVAVTWGAVAIGAVVTGIIFASKAETNLDKHGALVSAARSNGPRPRSDRDWDEHAYEYEIEYQED